MALTLGGYDRIIRHGGNGIEAVEIVWHPGTRSLCTIMGRGAGRGFCKAVSLR